MFSSLYNAVKSQHLATTLVCNQIMVLMGAQRFSDKGLMTKLLCCANKTTEREVVDVMKVNRMIALL